MLTQTRCWRSLDRKLISVDTLMSGDAKRRELKIAADGDNTWQIGQIKVASYCQNKQQKDTFIITRNTWYLQLAIPLGPQFGPNIRASHRCNKSWKMIRINRSIFPIFATSMTNTSVRQDESGKRNHKRWIKWRFILWQQEIYQKIHPAFLRRES